jgi:hypothetical protein
MRTLLDTPPDGATVRDRTRSAPKHIAAIDLGQAQDYTAFSIVERVPVPTGKFRDTGERQLVRRQWTEQPTMSQIVEPDERTDLHVRYLHRYPLRTDYIAMAEDVAAKIAHLIALPESGDRKPPLVIDHTGVGRAVFDVFRRAGMGIPLIGITITGGHTAHRDPDRPWEWHVPKKDLVSALQVAVQNDRLKIAPQLELAKVLAGEMQNFRMKVTTAANVTYEHWRNSDHDDLVLSVAMAAWMSERMETQGGLM